MKSIKKAITKVISPGPPGFVLLLAIVLGCGEITRPARKGTPDFKISVRDLEKEINENEAAARTKYRGKTVAIKGKVELKSEMSVILVSPENISFPVQCFFNASDRDSYQQIRRGREYTLIGVFNGDHESSASIISDCKLY
jgi:hypothetical protein